MVFFPEVLFFVLNIIKKGPVEDTAAFLRHSHLWALVIMIGILPSFPKIKSIEQSIRRKIHRKALIPDGGKRLITQLKNYPQTFKPQKGYTEKVFTDEKRYRFVIEPAVIGQRHEPRVYHDARNRQRCKPIAYE